MKRILLPAIAITAILSCALYLNSHQEQPQSAAAQPRPDAAPAVLPRATVDNDASLFTSTVLPEQNATDLTPAALLAHDDMPMDSTTGVFPVDVHGRLLLNQQTRLSLEAVIARTEPGKLDDAKGELEQSLPPPARAQALELLERYDEYQIAQKQSFPPGNPPANEDQALAELDGMHALRVAHFGPEVAAALYGEEEKITRQLIELMRIEKDESMTMEEKAVRAQAKLAAMPELSQLNAKNRTSVNNN